MLFRSQPPDVQDLMHIRWCPTGPFTSLPIHASAGYELDPTAKLELEVSIDNPVIPLLISYASMYQKDGLAKDSLSDYAISSYISTLSTLLQSQRQPPDITFQGNILAVIQPDTPDQAPLPGAIEELNRIKTRISGPILKSLVGVEATVDAVLEEMKNASIVHFACHGIQDTTHPLSSRLLLHGGYLSLAQLMYTSLPNARLAFLSACETATGRDDLPDEAVHLAAGMLAAGFKSIIGTMWAISDSAAPIVADGFYARLLKHGKVGYGKAAEALHYAVEDLRKQNPSDFMAWVPFIHMGA